VSPHDAMPDRLLARLDLPARRRLDALLEDLVDVLDSFDRLLGPTDGADGRADDLADRAMVRSVRGIARQLDRSVTEAGLRRFGAVGDSLDLDLHVVVGTGPGEDGIVTAVERGGYEKDGRVIRPADVVVGQGSVGGEQ